MSADKVTPLEHAEHYIEMAGKFQSAAHEDHVASARALYYLMYGVLYNQYNILSYLEKLGEPRHKWVSHEN